MLRIGSENFVPDAGAPGLKAVVNEGKLRLSSAPYAESDSAQQNSKRQRFPSGSRSPGPAKSCGNMPRAGISCPRKAASASATCPNRPKWTRPTRIGSSRTCRSPRRSDGFCQRLAAALQAGLEGAIAGPILPAARPSRAAATRKRALRGGDLSRTVCFRQGLWTEDLRTPPEQECSNGWSDVPSLP